MALKFGERPEVAYALPFSVDGMLVVASVVMVDDKRRNNRVRPIARLAFTAGVLASVAANIAAAHPNVGARIVAAWPAVALLLVVEMLSRPPASAAAEVPPNTAAQPHPPTEIAASPPRPRVPTQLPPPAVRVHPAAAHPAARTNTQPPVAHLPRPGHTGAIGATARVNATAHVADGCAVRAPIAATAHPTGAAETPVPPCGVVPPQQAIAVPPAATAVVAAEPARFRRDGSGTRAAEAATAVEHGRRAEPSSRKTAARRRRPTAATRNLARQILDAEPHLSRTEVAARLGVSTRRLREVLPAPA